MATYEACRWKLLAAQFLSAWGDRMWQFAMTLFIIEIFQDTLLYTAIYGLAENLVVLLLGPYLGRMVDRYPRLRLIFFGLSFENAAAAITCGLFYYSLVLKADNNGDINSTIVGLFVAITVISPIGEAASTLSTIAIEKDWVLVIIRTFFNDDEEDDALAELNSAIRRVDLSCKVCSPISVGLISSAWGVKAAIAFVGLWNVTTFFIEYLLVKRVYDAVPQLAERQKSKTIQVNMDEEEQAKQKVKNLSWCDYIKHRVFPASFAYCLLYFNLLTNGSLSTTFLRWSGMSDLLLSLFRGISAVFGISSTFVMPKILNSCGIVSSSFVMVWIFTLSLSPCFLAFAFNWGDSTLPQYGIIMFVGGIMISRFGLWAFDLGITQIMQTWVDSNRIGEMNGYQKSITNIMYLLSWALVLYFSDPREFRWPVLASFASVVISAIIYTIFYCVHGSTHPVEDDVDDSKLEEPLLIN